MAIEIPSVQPEQITVGNTLKFTFDAGDYTPDVYTLTYHLANAGGSYSVTGSDNGDGTYLVHATAATTEGWLNGDYSYYITATDGTDRYTVTSGSVTLLPDPASGNFDGRSHVKRTLDILESVVESRVEKDTVSYSIGGRSISKMDMADIQALYDKYKALYAQEQQAERLAKGLGSSRKIKIRVR